MLEVTQSLVLQFFMVLYYPAPSPIIMVPVQQCKMAVVISKVKILLEIDPFFAEAWIMASRLDDHSRSCFWHPVRAGRPTALWGQTMTFKMLTPVTPGWASSRVQGLPSKSGLWTKFSLGLFSSQNLPNKNLLDWTQLLIQVDSCPFPNSLKFLNLGITRLWWYTKAKAQDIKIDFPLKTRKQDTSLLTLETLEDLLIWVTSVWRSTFSPSHHLNVATFWNRSKVLAELLENEVKSSNVTYW